MLVLSFFSHPITPKLYTLSLHDALPISRAIRAVVAASSGLVKLLSTSNGWVTGGGIFGRVKRTRSEEHTSELQSLRHLVCRLLLEKKKNSTYLFVKHTTRLQKGYS